MLCLVEDAITDTTDETGFTNGSADTEEYRYDANGNLIEDKNKGIQITYNYVNLPTKIEWTNLAPAHKRGSKIEITYSATGEKLRMVVRYASGYTKTTDYVGGFEYENNELQHFPMSEGRVIATSSPMQYEYFYKDHLGNVRMSWKYEPAQNTPVVTQEDFYYPFGIRRSLQIAGLGNGEAMPSAQKTVCQRHGVATTVPFRYNKSERDCAEQIFVQRKRFS